MRDWDTYDLTCALITGMMIGIFLFAMMSHFLGFVSVDIESYGSRVCESKGLAYDTYSWEETDRGTSNIPIIYCKVPSSSVIYNDGLVIYERN